MDTATRDKWDRASKSFDLMAAYGPEWRWEPYKRGLFEHMRPDARILFLALGTGLDIQFFPAQRSITAIDISPGMLAHAQPRVDAYDGSIEALEMDVHALEFDDGSFDQIFTSCTFCSVPRPIDGLRSLRRVLAPDGELRMFEHTGSRYYPFKLMMHAMTAVTRHLGPAMNRTTVANVEAAGFALRSVDNLYLDVVKTIHAVKAG